MADVAHDEIPQLDEHVAPISSSRPDGVYVSTAGSHFVREVDRDG